MCWDHPGLQILWRSGEHLGGLEIHYQLFKIILVPWYHSVLTKCMVDCHPGRSASHRKSRTTVVNILIIFIERLQQLYHQSSEANSQSGPEDVQLICWLELNHCRPQSPTQPGEDVSDGKFAVNLKSSPNDVSDLISKY